MGLTDTAEIHEERRGRTSSSCPAVLHILMTVGVSYENTPAYRDLDIGSQSAADCLSPSDPARLAVTSIELRILGTNSVARSNVIPQIFANQCSLASERALARSVSSLRSEVFQLYGPHSAIRR